MADKALYSYTLSGRRIGMVFALVVSVIMMAFAAHHDAPWYMLAPVGLSAAMALVAIIANPQTGSTLTSQSLEFFNQGTRETIDIKDVASMKVVTWTDGPDTVTLTLKTGRAVRIPSLCADSKLAIALRSLGVREIDAN
jgi:hypothetical protein